ncbi:MAG: DinB family protein [Acidobacteriota bacterium]|nr:DinB family protein [Acidobacteriota bacterium]
MGPWRASVIGAFNEPWTRLRARLNGLEDDELFWEPVAGCWSVRSGDEGRWVLEGGDPRERASAPPVTTIAWRLSHLGGEVLGGFAHQRFGAGESTFDAPEVVHAARDVDAYLERHYRAWCGALEAISDDEWASPLGEGWGPYAASTTADLALHVLDEVTHHAAEVAVLRDLYARRFATRP